MNPAPPRTLHYRRSRFVTDLPVDFCYSPSHYWLAPQEGGVWRVGLTKFATRMLGEMVEHGFEIPPGATVASGQIIGWVEGFKAIADVFCVADGSFLGANSALKEKITLINQEPYGAGWLYAVNGRPDANGLDVHAYRDLLDKTIDKILERQQREDESAG